MRTISTFTNSLTQKCDTYLLESINHINTLSQCPILHLTEKSITTLFN